MKEVIYIFIGGGVGSVLRYMAQAGITERIPGFIFPWGTFTVNIIGSMLIGLFYSLSSHYHLSTDLRLFLTVGLCGGFTTFSTFSNEGVNLLKEEYYATFMLYALASLVVGLAAVFLGGYIGKQIG